MLPSAATDERDFHLPITKTWLFQLILGLTRLPLFVPRRRELLRICSTCQLVGTIHNRLQSAADKAAAINSPRLSATEWDCRTKYSRKSTSVAGSQVNFTAIGGG